MSGANEMKVGIVFLLETLPKPLSWVSHTKKSTAKQLPPKQNCGNIRVWKTPSGIAKAMSAENAKEVIIIFSNLGSASDLLLA